MQESVRILMRRDDMLETFSELAVKEPDLMRLVLQACVAALVNVQSAEAVEVEMKRRAVVGIEWKSMLTSGSDGSQTSLPERCEPPGCIGGFFRYTKYRSNTSQAVLSDPDELQS